MATARDRDDNGDSSGDEDEGDGDQAPTFPQHAAGDGRLRLCRRTFPDSLLTSGEELVDPRSCCWWWRKS